jgi:hypothetical protein
MPAPPTAWDYIVYHDTRTAILWKVPIDFVRIIVYNMYRECWALGHFHGQSCNEVAPHDEVPGTSASGM